MKRVSWTRIQPVGDSDKFVMRAADGSQERSLTTINKLNRGDNVTSDVLVKICRALDCKMDDIMEILPDNPALKDAE